MRDSNVYLRDVKVQITTFTRKDRVSRFPGKHLETHISQQTRGCLAVLKPTRFASYDYNFRGA